MLCGQPNVSFGGLGHHILGLKAQFTDLGLIRELLCGTHVQPQRSLTATLESQVG